MEIRIGICSECKRKGRLNAKGVCSECTYKKNHGGKSRQQVYRENQRAKPPKKRKVTGEFALFEEIWSERPHICNNCKITLSPITRRAFVKMFSHIKSKGAYPELRLDKSNIELLCHDCHDLWEFGDREEFYKRKVMD